jgi:glycosyltransferase involved in cell wall biosynthesis
MKLVIQIPCYNEEGTLPITLSCLPKQLAGIDQIELLVIDDGSNDSTVAVAKRFGVEHVVRFTTHRGLARAFMAGVEAALGIGADIIVNLDADNQYCADDISKLIEPIIGGRAEMVVGSRPIGKTLHFSLFKKFLQRLGSSVVRKVSKTAVEDAPSGFRALSRSAAVRMNVFSDYTYTLETIIQAGRRGITVISVPIRTNSQSRPSRLVKSNYDYVWRSLITILRIFMTYCPMRFFFMLGALPLLFGLMLGVRWMVLFWGGGPASHIPSLVLAAVQLIVGIQLWVLGLVADLMAVNRVLLEDIQLRIRQSATPSIASSERPNVAALTMEFERLS